MANFEISDSYQNTVNRKLAQARIDELKEKAKEMTKCTVKYVEKGKEIIKEHFTKKL